LRPVSSTKSRSFVVVPSALSTSSASYPAARYVSSQRDADGKYRIIQMSRTPHASLIRMFTS
jgi:hypothetical protein